MRENFLEVRASSLRRLSSLAGQTLGAYTLVSPIGQGGMGSVWLAERSDGRFEGQVAVKLLNARARRAGRRGALPARRQHPRAAHAIRTSRT